MSFVIQSYKEETLRSQEVETGVWESIKRARKNVALVDNLAMPAREMVIDLAKAWRGIDDGSGGDEVKNLNAWVDDLANVVEPALMVTIRGTISLPSLFSALYVIRSRGRAIRYEIEPGTYIPLF